MSRYSLVKEPITVVLLIMARFMRSVVRPVVRAAGTGGWSWGVLTGRRPGILGPVVVVASSRAEVRSPLGGESWASDLVLFTPVRTG